MVFFGKCAQIDWSGSGRGLTSGFWNRDAKLETLSILEFASMSSLGKFSPGLIGTWSGLDQTQQSRSRSEIFPKKRDCLVSGLGNPILAEMVPDSVWTGTT